MATMKMFMMLVVATIMFCSHHQAVVAREVVVDVDVVEDGNKLKLWPWEIPCYLPWPFPFPRPYPCPPPKPRPSPPPPPPRSPPPPPPSPPPPPPAPATTCSPGDKAKVKKCMFNTTSIDECCPTFQSILGTSCPCYKYAEDLDNQVLITLEAYCDVVTPCRSPPPKPSCPASDQEKVKTCMFNTTSIDECCPTFNSILGTSCPCYKYAEDLDNQVLITLESYCDVNNPCNGVQVIKLSKDDE
ncbi:uncharacterized protein LOC125835847 [Solanum verrucosum]|nr:uncharacterized protein LOC125835847 [Solanum verrucosum]